MTMADPSRVPEPILRRSLSLRMKIARTRERLNRLIEKIDKHDEEKGEDGAQGHARR